MNECTKQLFILRGLPGSGKTTLAGFLMDNISLDVTVCMFAADDFFTDESGVYNFDATKLKQAHDQCFNNARKVMQEVDSDTIIIVHNTFTTEKELKPYIELAKEFGFTYTSLIVENLHGNTSIHSVPEEAMTRMKNRFKVNL